MIRPRAVVAESQPLMRAGLRAVLEASGADVAYECDDVDGLVAAVGASAPSVALVDLALAGDVLGAIHHLTNDRAVAVVALADVEAGGEVAAVRAGAVGVVYRDTVCAQLPHAVAAVLAGETAIPRRLVPALLAELRVPEQRSAGAIEMGGLRLTEREREVLERLADGQSTRQVAEALFVEPVTVRSHVCALLHKLGQPDRESLIHWARRRRSRRVPA